MSIGTGWRMISLKNFSLNSILLSHSVGSSGLRSFHQNSGAAGCRRAALLLNPEVITSVYGPLWRTYLNRLPGLLRGNEHNAIVRAMKPRSASVHWPDKLVYLIGEGEAPPCRWWGFADRRHQPAQVGENFSNGNQLAALTLHGGRGAC